jgi:hypothetical protein
MSESELTDNKKVEGEDSIGRFTEEAMIWGAPAHVHSRHTRARGKKAR